MSDVAIKVDKVSKSFKLPHEKVNSIKSVFVGLFNGKRTYEKQEVLKDISFEIKKGEFFGIIGRNGSGKSTLLKLLAGVYSPDKGAIYISGKLTPFIELGVGFNPELTARENVYLNGALLGFNRNEIDGMYDEIVEFAELKKFMDQKLKNYSSGMQVRLAFSIAIRSKSEILLLDEVLAVGDAIFQKKCYEYFKQLKKDKRTVVFVSHDTNAVLEYCDRALFIEQGKLVNTGDTTSVINAYLDILSEQQKSKLSVEGGRGASKADKNAPIEVKEAKTMDPNSNKSISLFRDENEVIGVKVSYQVNSNVDRPVYGVTILDAGGMRVFTSNTLWSKIATNDVKQGQLVTVIWAIPNAFNEGSFTITPAVADSSGVIPYDVAENAHVFHVSKKLHSISFINIEHSIEIKP